MVPGSYLCKTTEEPNANKTTNCVTDALNTVTLDVVGTSAAINQGNCISYTLPDKTSTGAYVADITKQKKFLTQYKSCFLTKMASTFKGLIETGTLPKQEIQAQKAKQDCASIVDSLITYSNDGGNKNAAEFYGAYDVEFKNNFWDKGLVLGKDNPDLYKKVIRAALLSKTAGMYNANGLMFSGYLKSHMSLFGPFEQALVNCSSVSNSNSGSLISMQCGSEKDSNNDGVIDSNDTNLSQTTTASNFYSPFIGLMIKSLPSDSSGTIFVDDINNPTTLYINEDGGLWFSLITNGNLTDDNSKILNIRDDLINVCEFNAQNQVAAMGYVQTLANQDYIDKTNEKNFLIFKINKI